MPPKKKPKAKGRKKKESFSEDDSDDSLVIRRPGAKGATRLMVVKDVSLILTEDDADATKAITWNDYASPPSMLPPHTLCSVCSQTATVKCNECTKTKGRPVIRYLCSRRCRQMHDTSGLCQKTKSYI
eukprot:Trichotokara_eunicae@DN5055_c0_g1_i1.p1